MIVKRVEGKVKVAGLSVYYVISVMLWGGTLYMNYSVRSSQCPLEEVISILTVEVRTLLFEQVKIMCPMPHHWGLAGRI